MSNNAVQILRFAEDGLWGKHHAGGKGAIPAPCHLGLIHQDHVIGEIFRPESGPNAGQAASDDKHVTLELFCDHFLQDGTPF